MAYQLFMGYSLLKFDSFLNANYNYNYIFNVQLHFFLSLIICLHSYMILSIPI